MATDMLGPNIEDLFNLCGRKFSLKTVLMIADACLSHIEYIHDNHIIHRDIKPENFIFDEKGYLYLADFGCAHLLNDNIN